MYIVPKGIYIVRATLAAETAVQTLIQVKAGATTPLWLVEAGISFSVFSEVSDTMAGIIVEKSAAATVTSFTPLVYGSAPAADAVGGTAATGVNATVEGTDGDILHEEAMNVLNGWLWRGTPETYIPVDAAGIIGLKLNLAITSSTVHCYVKFAELN